MDGLIRIRLNSVLSIEVVEGNHDSVLVTLVPDDESKGRIVMPAEVAFEIGRVVDRANRFFDGGD